MRTFVLCYLALLILGAVVNARNTTSLPDNSSEQENTPQCCRSCDLDSATGEEGGDALSSAIHQVLQEAMRLHEQKAETASREVLHQQLQEQDGDIDAGPHSLNERVAVKSKSPKEEDGDATAEGQLVVRQLENRLSKLEAAVERVLEQVRIQSPEGQMKESSSEYHTSSSTFISSPAPSISASSSPPPFADSVFGATTTEVPLPEEEREKRPPPFADSVFGATTTEVPLTEEEREKRPPPFADSVFGATTTEVPPTEEEREKRPPPFADSVFRATTTEVPLTEEEREKQLLELRILEVTAQKKKAREDPSPLGEDLFKAVHDGNVERVRRFLHFGADINYTNSDGNSPLVSIFYSNLFGTHSAVASLLVKRGADLNAINEIGMSALHIAAFQDSSNHGVPFLIDAGAHVDARDGWGATPLFRAAWAGMEENVRALLAAGANKSIRCWGAPFENWRPIDKAKTSAIRVLLRS